MVRTGDPDVWNSTLSKRVLFNTDLLIHSTTLMQLTASVARLQQHLPANQQLRDVRFGPQQQPLFSAPCVFLMYGATAAAALGLLATRPHTYFQWRWWVCVSIRLLRLVVQLSTMLTPAAVAALAGVMVSRGQEAPQKATAIMIIQPLAYYIQPAMVLLPWRHVLLMQLASTAGMLHWLWLFPCFLQAFLQQQEVQPIQGAAEEYCHRVRSVVALFRAATGGLVSDFSDAACTDLNAMQSLQVFVNLVFLLGLPVLLSYAFERWLRSRASSMQPQQQPTPPVGAGSNSRQHFSSGASSSRQASSSSAGGANTSRPADASSDALPVLPATDGEDALALASLLDGIAGAGQAQGHLLYLVLVLFVMLPVMWMLAELVAQAFQAHRDCAPILAAAGVPRLMA